ncbi:hypothetical protein Godav_020893 [Gossypium davidsonii]|uniref:Uncharacterized protein n=2 Tax=Gossypium TaxID=3633 RepID=A0A7J8R537_GOSDV|nr:hypothetical protein [Gossypium davidsonii]MBA0643734.1 hypothetical protein [Gossypium klotzschianum]
MVFSSFATMYGQSEKIPCVEDFKLKYIGISSSIGLTANPVVNFSGVLGTNVFH